VSWVKVSPAVIAVTCALVIIANTPAVLLDPLALAVAQIRQNAAKTELSVVQPQEVNVLPQEETPAPKKIIKG